MYNKAVLVGRLTADPEIKTTTSGKKVCSFTVACDRPYSGSSNERAADFINVVAWESRASFVGSWFQKGSPIGIEGPIQTRSYEDRNGVKRTATEVIASQIFFVGGNYSKRDSDSSNFGSPVSEPSPTYSSGAASDFEEMESDNDLPF